MGTKKPSEIAEAAVESGVAKAHLRWDKVLIGAFLAGAYIAFGGLVAISVSSGLDPATWGTLPTLFMGAAFTLGLILPGGADRRGRPRRRRTRDQRTMIYEKLASIASSKGLHENAWQIFLRGIGCNWLVCLGVWIALAADSVGSKVLGMFFPIMAFVAMGFDHVVANMFFLPAAIFAGVPGLDWGEVLHNWVFAFLGNLVGAVVFVSTSYWYLYLRPDHAHEPQPAQRGA